MSSQSVMDRITAARYSISGQNLAKTVCKATTEEVIGPKKKHLSYLVQCTNEPNVSPPELVNFLLERTQHTNWVVVFKSLSTIHHLINYGNERFIQVMASNNYTLNLNNFLDKSGVQGYSMSTYVRHYAKYINEKAISYRQMAFDFCKVKRGKEDGMLRTMSTEKLLKALPILQTQLDALIAFDVSANELTNGVINFAFMLLFKDLIRLFACYNDGIINLLEKYFDMNKKQCKEAFELYKNFLIRMEGVGRFLKVAENMGIDKGDIPDLSQAPASLVEALEEHLKSQDKPKKTPTPDSVPSKPSNLASAINLFAASAASASNARDDADWSPTLIISEEERMKVLEEEKRYLELLKEKRALEVSATTQQQPAPSLVQMNAPSAQPPSAFAPVPRPQSGGPFASQDSHLAAPLSADLFDSSPAYATVQKVQQQPAMPSQDLFSLDLATPSQPAYNPFAAPQPASNNPFAQPMMPDLFATQPTAQYANNPFSSGAPVANGGMATSASAYSFNSGSTPMNGTATGAVSWGTPQPQFALGGASNMTSGGGPPPGFDGGHAVLQPVSAGGKPHQPMAAQFSQQPAAKPTQPQTKLIGSDLDASLATLAGNLNMNVSGYQFKKTGQALFSDGSEKKKTGGDNWQAPPPSVAMASVNRGPPMSNSPMLGQPAANYQGGMMMPGYPAQMPAGGGLYNPMPPQMAGNPQMFASGGAQPIQQQQQQINDPFGLF